jgi:hypothetical protein
VYFIYIYIYQNITKTAVERDEKARSITEKFNKAGTQ